MSRTDLEAYHAWDRRLLPSWRAVWPIARTGLTLVARRVLFWLLGALALLNFLFVFAVIYLKSQLAASNPEIARFADGVLRSASGTGETYRDFMFAQGTVTMLLLAFAGTTLVGDDLRRGGLTFYLSRRIHRWHYAAGKLLAVALLTSLITTLPALVLYVQYGLLTSSFDYFRENLNILRGILGYGAAIAVTLSLLLFATASWLRRTVPLASTWACLFILLPAVGGILRRAFDNRYWELLAVWRNLRLVGTWCFGAVDTEREAELLVPSLVVLGLVWLLAILVSLPRIRAVRVAT